MESSENRIEIKGALKSIDKERLWVNPWKFFGNIGAAYLALGLEVARFANVNLRGREFFGVTTPLPAEPILTILQSLGDTGAGFFVSAMSYEAIDVLSSPLKGKVPEQLKVGAAVFLGILTVAAHEKGKFMSGSRDVGSDLDIIGGSIGPIAFIGFNMLLNRFIRKVDKKIEKINLLKK